MNQLTRITVPLSKEEFFALRNSAANQYRHPRDQARHILRMALLGEQKSATNENTGAAAAKHTHAGILTVAP
jgi:plasmid stability protein